MLTAHGSMLTAYGSAESSALLLKARKIELQAARAAPSMATQLRSLAAQYYAEAKRQRLGKSGDSFA